MGITSVLQTRSCHVKFLAYDDPLSHQISSIGPLLIGTGKSAVTLLLMCGASGIRSCKITQVRRYTKLYFK